MRGVQMLGGIHLFINLILIVYVVISIPFLAISYRTGDAYIIANKFV